MAIRTTDDMLLSPDRRELAASDDPAFPCVGYDLRYAADSVSVPWHWHEELEVVRVVEGRMRFRLSDGARELRPGEGLLVNANVLHAADGAPTCRMRSIVFHPRLVTGEEGSAFETRYLSPLMGNPGFVGLTLGAGRGADLVRAVDLAFDALAREGPGFEFLVREQLSRLCLGALELLGETAGEDPARTRDERRVRQMISHIRAHLAERLTVADVAAAAQVGERECLRCFRRVTGTSPMRYAERCRLDRAASLLAGSPELCVAEVGRRCGFESPAHFSAVFRRRFGVTPSAWRRDHVRGGIGGPSR